MINEMSSDFHHENRQHIKLSWRLFRGKPLRLLPRQGEPYSVYEWVTQKFIKFIAYLPIYTAIVVTLVLYVLIFGVPFVKGD